MANIKVKDLTDTTTISSDNQLMVLTNDANNTVQNITVENFNQNIISTDADNGITQGADGNLFVDNSDSGVTAGTYQYPQNLVVDAKGKITSVQSGSSANVPIATTSQAGIVKPDGTTITVESDGTISAILRNIGEIVASTIPLTDAGLHLLDGALLSGDGIYAAFVDYIGDLYDSGDYTAIFTTEANWQTAVTTYGVCGKFVYTAASGNDPATVRLPLYNSKIYTGGGKAPVIGNGIALGITDGTTEYGLSQSPNTLNHAYVGTSFSGATVGTTPSVSGIVYPANNLALGVSTDATKSGVIADLANITTSLDGYYYIVVATSTKTDIQVDIDEIATDLNGKADTDLSNTAAKLSDTFFNKITPDYTNGISSSLTANYQTYTCPSAGVVVLGGNISNNGTTNVALIINGVSVGFGYNAGSSAYNTCVNAEFLVSKDDVCQYKSQLSSGGTFTFYPMKGVN